MPKKKDYSEDSNNFFFDEQNKKKKKLLTEKYGMLHSGEGEYSSPEIVNKFLNYVEQFEEKYETAENKKIIEILGNPEFKKHRDLSPVELEREIVKVLEKYAEFNMFIDVIEEDEVSDEDFYRFITEELPQHVTYLMNIEGMNTNFIYEEFHPSDKLDAKDTIDYFKCSVIEKKTENIMTWLDKDQLYFNGEPKSAEKFIEAMFKLIPTGILDSKINFISFEFDYFNKVNAEFIIDYKPAGNNVKKLQKILMFEFDLARCEFGGFSIKGCTVK